MLLRLVVGFSYYLLSRFEICVEVRCETLLGRCPLCTNIGVVGSLTGHKARVRGERRATLLMSP